MNSDERKNRTKSITVILIAWLLVSTFGDEVVGLMLFGWDSDALSLSMMQAWWWYYQLAVLLVFAPVLLGAFIWHRTGR